MRNIHNINRSISQLAAVVLAVIAAVDAAALSDVLNLNTDSTLRVPRDSKYYLDRRGSESQRDVATSRLLKPEETAEARDNLQETSVGKRCTRCDTAGYSDYRGSSYSSPRADYRYQPRYESGRYDDRYDRYDSYDRYDPYDSYSSYDYYERDGGYRRPYSSRDLYDRDRYEPRDRYSGGRDRYSGRDYDRGIGYDNIGYDYRGSDSRGGYRPYDETSRGTSGFDTAGRGYYSNRGTPDYGRYGGVYASSWGYGRDRDYRDGGGYRGYRPRDYHSYGTSYLYDRPSSSTTTSSPGNESDRDNSVTDTPHDSHDTSSTG